MTDKLHLYEELMLLALHDQKGTLNVSFIEHAVIGASLAELLQQERITIEDSREKLVEVVNNRPVNDPLIDDCLQAIRDSKKPRSINHWIHTLSQQKNLWHRIAYQLCQRGILSDAEDKVLLLFSRRIYPEINPRPEQEIITRIKAALDETSPSAPDPQTIILIAIADGVGLLRFAIGKAEAKRHKHRIDEIVKADKIGLATREVIQAIIAMLASVAATTAIISS